MDLFEDLTDDDLAAATRAYLRSPKAGWWPAPGEVLALVPRRQAAAIEDADEVWGEVRDASSRGAETADAMGWSPATRAAVRAVGGWDRIGYTPYDQHVALRASFRAAYRSACARGVLEADHPQLTDAEAGAVLRRIAAGPPPEES